MKQKYRPYPIVGLQCCTKDKMCKTHSIFRGSILQAYSRYYRRQVKSQKLNMINYRKSRQDLPDAHLSNCQATIDHHWIIAMTYFKGNEIRMLNEEY